MKNHLLSMKRPRGYVALLSVLLLSAILLGLTTTVASTGFFSRGNSLTAEYKRISLGLAESCMNQALLRLAQDADYEGGDTVSVNGNDCTIETIGHPAYDASQRKTLTLVTSAHYPKERGAFSTIETSVGVLNPEAALAPLFPACTLEASPVRVLPGKEVVLQWSTSSNTSDFDLTPVPSPSLEESETAGGARTYVAPTSPGQITYTGRAASSGGAGECTATVTVSPEPPTPSCADTVVVLDRSEHMTAADLSYERSAGNALVAFFDLLTPFPKLGVGSFGGLSGAPASVPTDGQLGSSRNSLESIIENITATNSSVGSNLKAAIDAARTELLEARATEGNRKVLILVSDGIPSKPTGILGSDREEALRAADEAKRSGIELFTVRVSANTDEDARTFLAELASGDVPVNGHEPGTSDDSAQILVNTPQKNPSSLHTPNGAWSTPSFALGTPDISYAVSALGGSEQGFSNFGFSLPNDLLIAGIEISIVGKAGAATSLWSLTDRSFGTVTLDNISGWDEAGNDDVDTSNQNNDVDPTTRAVSGGVGNDSPSIDGGAFAKIAAGEWICHSVNAVGQSNLALSYYWRGDPDGINGESAVVEYRSDGSCTSASGWTSITTHELDAGNNNADEGWLEHTVATLPDNLSGYIRIRNLASGVNTFFRVDGASLASGGGGTGTCELSVALSSTNGGFGGWTTPKTITLPTTESTVTIPMSTWGRTWTKEDFEDGAFVLRLTNSTCTGQNAAAVNAINATIRYDGYDPSEENTDEDNYFIALPTSENMEDLFETIGRQACPAAAPACANGIDDDGDGFTDDGDNGCENDDDTDEWASPPLPDPPLPPPPPPPITIWSWRER